MAKNMPVPSTRTLNVTKTIGIQSIILCISKLLIDTIHREERYPKLQCLLLHFLFNPFQQRKWHRAMRFSEHWEERRKRQRLPTKGGVAAHHDAYYFKTVFIHWDKLSQLKKIQDAIDQSGCRDWLPYQLSSTTPAYGCQKNTPFTISIPHLPMPRYVIGTALY